MGGTHGIGRAAALAVARTGSSILLVARSRDAGEAAIAEIRVAGARRADFLSADLSTVAGMQVAGQGIAAWNPVIHGLTHSAMSPFSRKIVTVDGLELAFALQYLARAVVNRLCANNLAAAGDGRIVHIAGAVPYKMAPPVLDDLQFERRKWSFFKAILTTHVMGFMFLQEASRRWADKPIGLYAACVASTKTKVMKDPAMPLIMRLMGRLGTTPEKSAQNAIRLLVDPQAAQPRAAILKNPKKLSPEPFVMPADRAAQLWDITTRIAADKSLELPDGSLDVSRTANVTRP